LTDKRCSLSWQDLRGMTLIEVFDMHRALDLRDALEAKAATPPAKA
jgi:hypothetical protein